MVNIDARLARRDKRRLMNDRCRITREGELLFDPSTGRTLTTTEVIYEGRCWAPSSSATDAELGSADIDRQKLSIEVEWFAPVQTGDIVTVTRADDTDLLTRRLVVATVASTSVHTARRLTVEEVRP